MTEKQISWKALAIRDPVIGSSKTMLSVLARGPATKSTPSGMRQWSVGGNCLARCHLVPDCLSLSGWRCNNRDLTLLHGGFQSTSALTLVRLPPKGFSILRAIMGHDVKNILCRDPRNWVTGNLMIYSNPDQIFIKTDLLWRCKENINRFLQNFKREYSHDH